MCLTERKEDYWKCPIATRIRILPRIAPDANSSEFNPEGMDVFRPLPSKTFYKRPMGL
jgi:hypothetical protein